MGDVDVVTGQSVALEALTKYDVAVLTATGLTKVFDFDGSGVLGSPGMTLPTQGVNCVIVAQSALIGNGTPYFSAGHFNHALLNWPAALDTLAKRKAFFAGTPIQIGELLLG